MKTEIKDLSAFKKATSRTRNFFNKKGYAISNAEMIEAMSIFLGAKNYNVLKERFKKIDNNDTGNNQTFNNVIEEKVNIEDYIIELEKTESSSEFEKFKNKEIIKLLKIITDCHEEEKIKNIMQDAIINFYDKTENYNEKKPFEVVTIEDRKRICRNIMHYIEKSGYFVFSKDEFSELTTIMIDEITGYSRMKK